MSNKKIIWAEGIFLGQQHFQQWDRQIHDDINNRFSITNPNGWGLVECAYIEEEISTGQFRLKKCNAVFRNGFHISFNDSVDGELSCELKGKEQNKIIYLAFSKNQQVDTISGYEKLSDEITWRGRYKEICDLYDKDRISQVLVGELNLKLMQTGDILDEYHTFPVARLNYTVAGYQVDEMFIPISLRVSASRYLKEEIEKLLYVIRNKISDVLETTDKQYLQSVYYALTEYNVNSQQHPEQVFMVLNQLLGRLRLTTLVEELLEVPLYVHDEPEAVFPKLFSEIHLLMAQLTYEPVQLIQLEKFSNNLSIAVNITKDATSNIAGLVIAIKLDDSDSITISHLMNNIKISAPDRIQELVKSATSGLSIRYLKNPPQSLVSKPGYEYFQLMLEGKFWEQILAFGQMAIYRSQLCCYFSMELLTVKEW